MHQIDTIKLLILWNGYALHIRNPFITRLRNDTKAKGRYDKNDKKKLFALNYLILDIKEIKRRKDTLKIPKMPDKKGFFSLVTKQKNLLFLLLRRHFSHNCLICPCCKENYIGKTDRNLVTRLHEHRSRDNQAMHQHHLKWEHFIDTVNLMRLPDIDSTSSSVVKKEDLLHTVLFHFRNVGSCSNWFQLLFRRILHQDVSAQD